MNANALERSILKGAKKAQKQYISITGGYWLWHGPESFLQICIAQEIGKLGYAVYVDASVKKTQRDMQRGPGRPTNTAGQRPDISIWKKSRNEVLAILEIKRTFNFSAVGRDAKKISKHLNSMKSAKTGYVLVYSEASGSKNKDRRAKMAQIFDRWQSQLPSWRTAARHVAIEKADQRNAWGVVLFRKN